MEHVAALLLIVGCSADMKSCSELPAPTPIYETTEDCSRDLQGALAAAKTLRAVVRAACVPVDPAIEEEDAELTWDVRPDGRLIASVQTASPDMLVTSSIHGADAALAR